MYTSHVWAQVIPNTWTHWPMHTGFNSQTLRTRSHVKRQAVLESTTCRTFEEPMAGRTKSYCKIRSVANMLSCTSNLADTWFACFTMKNCWGALLATQMRQFADTVQNTSTATTTFACTKIKSFGNQKCTRAHTLGPMICAYSDQINAQKSVDVQRRLVTSGKEEL